MLLGAVSFAAEVDKATAAEVVRLQTSLDTLAQKSSWDGVERMYRKLLELQVPLTPHIHYTASMSSQARGEVDAAWARLERALREPAALEAEPDGKIDLRKCVPDTLDEADPEVVAARGALEALRSRYGRVSIVVDAKRLPILIRMGAKPFSSTEREAITSAQSHLSQRFVFEGPLPVGKYMVDGQMFEVEPAGKVTVEVLPR